MNKEQDRPLSPEELALKQVEGYIEKIEKQAELPRDPSVTRPSVAGQITLPQPIVNDAGQVLLQQSTPADPDINLPLSQLELKEGLHKQVADSVRWLAEWCIRTIKKYPGRVFYKD